VGVAADRAQAVKLLQEACRDDSVYDRRSLQSCTDACGAGDAASCQLARLPGKAARLYESACGRGEARGCQALAQMYDRGELGRNQGTAAARFHERACELGLARACYDLGVVYVRTDAARAVLLYEKACAGGEAEACSAAGYLLRNGAPNLPPDKARAEDLLARERALEKEKR
jgi:TPR repeat protein